MTVTADIVVAMREAYKQPEWALFLEVGNGTGATCRRHADAVAMNMYPSRGLTLSGFEFKVSRSDWKNELKNPEKAEAVAKYCDFFYVVAPKEMIHINEMPTGWGLIELLENGRLRTKLQASMHKTIPVDRSFVASLLRGQAKLDEGAIAAMVRKEVRAEREHDQKNNQAEIDKRTADYVAFQKKHAKFVEFMQRPGFSYRSEDEFAQACEIAMNWGLRGAYGTLQKFHEVMLEMQKVIDGLETLATAP